MASLIHQSQLGIGDASAEYSSSQYPDYLHDNILIVLPILPTMRHRIPPCAQKTTQCISQ